jgi:hypothetical protein
MLGELVPGELIPIPSVTPRGEHSLLFRRMGGKQRISPPGDTFAPRGQNLPLGDNFAPGGQSLPLGAKLGMGLSLPLLCCDSKRLVFALINIYECVKGVF